MKYALVVLSFLFVYITTDVQARTITSFKKSDALIGLSQFLHEVSPDLPESVKFSDRKIAAINYSKCQRVSSAFVLETFERLVSHVLRYYPDEEVPFEEAIYDLEDYLGAVKFYGCHFNKKTKYSNVESFYFVDASDTIHLRLDKITPLQE